MTEQQTESLNQEQPTQEQQQPSGAAPVEGYSNAEIEAMAKGEAQNPSQQATENEEGGERESDEDEEGPGENQGQEEKKEQENAEAAEEQKQRSKRVSRERFDEVNEQKNTYKSRNEELQRELEAERARNQRLADFIKKATAGTSEQDDSDEEVLDEALDKKVSGELKEIKQEIAVERFQRSLASEDAIGREKLKDYDNAVSFVVATEAHQIIARGAALGKKIPEEKAIEEAMVAINRDLYDVHQQSGRSGTIAQYVYDRAIARGFTPTQAKKTAEKSKVDMKAVERARQEAGAPAIERESVKINGANWNDDLAGRASKEFKPSDKRYLEKWGI